MKDDVMSHDHTDPPDAMTLRVKSLETLLVDRGLIDPEAVETFIQYYENEVGPRNGAQVVARAWVDPKAVIAGAACYYNKTPIARPTLGNPEYSEGYV